MSDQKDYQGASSGRASPSPWMRAYFRKYDELMALNRHPDDAAHEARGYASDQAEKEIASVKAAALVASLGVIYGDSATSTTTSRPPMPTPDPIAAVDWDAVLADLNANRR